jgi:D-ribose pyranase
MVLLLATGMHISESQPESLRARARNPCNSCNSFNPGNPGPTQIGMLNTGILNPQLLSLLARVRHTNALVIADRGFPFWPDLETVDLSLVDGLPTVLQVLAAIRPNFRITQAYMAREFLRENARATRALFAKGLQGIPTNHEPHVRFKKRVPGAIGLIRTGDTVQYANMILVSG